MASQSLRRFPRIRRRETLDDVIRTGEVARTPYFRVCYLSCPDEVARTPYFRVCYRTGEGPPGVAILAGRKVGGAVKRNRAKRVLREALRTSTADLSGIETLIFIASGRAADARYSDISATLQEELRRISDRDSRSGNEAGPDGGPR